MTLWKATKVDPELNEGPKATFSDAVGAAFRRDVPEAGFTPGRDLLDEVYKPLMDFTGGRYGEATELYLQKGADVSILRKMGRQSFHPDTETLEAFIADLDAKGIEYPADITPSNLAKRRERLEVARASNARSADEVISRASGVSQIFGGFLGSAAAQFTDPVNLMTLPIGASARMGLLSTVAIEAGINAGIEVAQTPGRNEYRRMIGQEETSVVENAVVGGIFGGGLAFGIKGAAKLKVPVTAGARAVGNFLATQSEKRTLAKLAAASEDPDARVIGEAVLRDLEDEAAAVTNPESFTVREHESRAQAATVAAQTGSPLDIPDRPAVAVPRTSIINGEIEEVDPRALLVMPETFQFKSDVVAAGGVTAKLLQNETWLSERAGIVLVYEFADGRRAIADGHQRTGLANRIMDRDPSQSIRLAARVFKESEGFSVDDVRVIAALKNIAEAADGMTTKMATDAAKVLRIRPEAIRDLPTGPGIARARELASLSDEAFDLVINRVLPPDQAALIGRLAPDPKMHGPLAKLLVRVAPESAAQTESVISQALQAPVERSVISDLFGEQEVAESLYLERAKVLERTMRMIRDDRQLARTLTEKGERVEGIGANRLDRESNQALRETMEKALAAVAALAHRAGPISEALNDAAKRYKGDGRLGDAADRVRAIVRNEIERNGLSGAGYGNAGRAAESQGSRATPPDPLEGFGDLEGPAFKEQIEATRIEPPTPEEEAANLVRQRITDQWSDYFDLAEGDELVPLSSLVATRARPEGIANAVPLMERAQRGEIDKRPALLLRDEGDGTFTIRDGNSTFAIASAAGWDAIPGRVVSDAEFQTEKARTAISRIFDTKMGKTKKRLVLQADLPQAEAQALHSALRSRQPFNSIEEAVQVQAVNQDSMNSAALEVAAGLDGSAKTAKVKKADRILDKLRRKFGDDVKPSDVRHVGDIARVAFKANTIDAADAFIAGMAKRFHVVDEGWIQTPVGYFDRKAAVVFDDGSVGEIQILPPGMAEAKSGGGHDAYKIWQNPDSPPEARATAEAQMLDLYGAVIAKLDSSFAEKLGIGAPNSSRNAAASSSDLGSALSSSRTASATTGDPPAGRQDPSASVIPRDPSTATSELSDQKNRIIPQPSSEKTPAGDQLLMPGVDAITQGDRLRAKADAPLRARPRGSDTEIGGLFDPNDPSRFDLFDLVPTGRSFDAEGNEIPLVMTRAEVKAELDADDEALAVMEVCIRGATR
jgi:hypothetical protein